MLSIEKRSDYRNYRNYGGAAAEIREPTGKKSATRFVIRQNGKRIDEKNEK